MICASCRCEMRLILDEPMGQTYHCLRCDKWVDISFNRKEKRDDDPVYDEIPSED